MYLLTVKDGLARRHIGPYMTTKEASDDLKRVLANCSERARWQIHALESPKGRIFSGNMHDEMRSLNLKAS